LAQFKPHFAKIEEAMDDVLVSHVALLREIAEHSFLGKGKRLRPLLFVLSCQLCGYREENRYRLSTVFECLHTASLLHDDVLDNAELRRSKPSAPRLWGNPAAVLAGDFFYSKGSSVAMEMKNFPFLNVLIDAAMRMVEGQILELVHTYDLDLSKGGYFDIITAKTAALMSAACASGAHVAGAGPKSIEALKAFGMNLGIAFQLIDDLLDYVSSEETFGKPVGKDLREGKITLPLIYALSRLESDDTERFGTFFQGEADEDEYRQLLEIVRKGGDLNRIRNEAMSYTRKATANLGSFPECSEKKELKALAHYMVHRSL
jgi:octaprenyl-diphosphate synthase